MITPSNFQRDPRGFQRIPYQKNYQTNRERDKKISEIEKFDALKITDSGTSSLKEKNICALKIIEENASALEIEDQMIDALGEYFKDIRLINYDNNNIDAPVTLETEEQIRKVYGEYFCKIAGIENLLKMPHVTAASLNIDSKLSLLLL